MTCLNLGDGMAINFAEACTTGIPDWYRSQLAQGKKNLIDRRLDILPYCNV